MKKKTHEEIEPFFRAEGYRLLDEYQTSHQKMRANCPRGHNILVTWGKFSSGRRCPECAKAVKANKRRTPESVVRKAFEDEGYQLLDQYHRNSIRMTCICPNGHHIKMDWASFQDGIRCRKCGHVKAGETRKSGVAVKAKAAFEVEGYTLLDGYKDSHSLMRFICPEGHQHQISWTNFDSGYRCVYCCHTAPVAQEWVQKSFEDEGYQLLDRYENKKRRLRFICPSGHKYSMSWDNWNAGCRCAICSKKVVTRKDVKEAFESEGYTLLGKYKKNNQELDFICPEGHRHSITWSNFQRGHRCFICNKPSVDPEFVDEFFRSAGYTPLNRYEKSESKIKYLCPEGHKHSITWHSFKTGSRCPECAGKIVRHEDVEMAFTSEGYRLLDRYANGDTKMRYVCPEGHQNSIIWYAFKRGHRCPYCAGNAKITDEIHLEINRIKDRIRGLIRIYLQKQASQKPFSLSTFSGKVASQVHNKLGPRPKGCHLDHIVPQSFFDFRNQEEIEACWDIENLRWLPSLENESRGNNLTVEEVKGFSQRQLEILAIASRKPKRFDALLAC